jgi:hypothetical protein
MECPELWLEGLTERTRSIEHAVTQLNVRVDQLCYDAQIQQAFSQIKTNLKGLEKTMHEALEKSAMGTLRK